MKTLIVSTILTVAVSMFAVPSALASDAGQGVNCEFSGVIESNPAFKGPSYKKQQNNKFDSAESVGSKQNSYSYSNDSQG